MRNRVDKIMMKKIFLLILSVLLFCETANANEANKIRMLFVGDIMAHQQQLDAAKYKGNDKTKINTWDFSPQFRRIRPMIENAFLIGNLETVFAGAGKKMNYTGYPTFNTPDSLADTLLDLKFDLLTLANNHIFDKGASGARRTTEVLDSRDITWIGLGLDRGISDDVIVLEHEGFKIAFINYTYGSNIYPKSSDVRLNIISEDAIQKSIELAKTFKPDIITACFHWGYEYHHSPSVHQKKAAEVAFNAGADLIVGTHPHVLQPIEISFSNDDRVRAVAWSLGNFVSFQRTLPRERTCILSVEFEKDEDLGFTRITRVAVAPVYVYAPGQKRTEITYAGSYEPLIKELDFSGISKQQAKKIRDIGNAIIEFLGANVKDIDEYGFYTLWTEISPDIMPISRRKTPK